MTRPAQWTDAQIAAACRVHATRLPEHPDCVRVAGEWLNAQHRTKTVPARWPAPLKHLVEGWACCYVTQDDVTTAARMLGLRGSYPFFNIASALTLPNPARLHGIAQAGAHPGYAERSRAEHYRRSETSASMGFLLALCADLKSYPRPMPTDGNTH